MQYFTLARLKSYYARLWAPLFLAAAYYFYAADSGSHHMMNQQLFGLPEMTWMWILMAFAHLHLYWDAACKSCACADSAKG